jgi:hypothetical protein
MMSSLDFGPWDEGKLAYNLNKIIPGGWFFATDASVRIVATAMCLHNYSGQSPFTGDVGWIACHPDNRGSILDSSLELFDRIMALNVRAPFFLMQGALQLMIEKRIRGGSIVNIIIMSSHGGQPFLTPYSTSKGALVTLTRNVANSAIKDRIGVVAFLLSDESGLISGSIIDFDQNVVGTYS